ncbi:MAG: hypothetical protein MUF39_10215, partial [Cyclobacteriaceae bacterium]|nr:hypothetical protein [Cyclobacteriaceae bacterium]
IFLELNKDSLSGFLYEVANMNFLYFCIVLFVICVIVIIGVSFATEKPSEEQLNGLTYATTVAEDRATSRATWNKTDVILSLIVLIIVITVFVYFSPLGVAG